MVDELKIYTVKWSAKIWGTEEVVAKNEKEATKIITNRVKNMKIYDSKKGYVKIDGVKEEKIKFEIVKTC